MSKEEVPTTKEDEPPRHAVGGVIEAASIEATPQGGGLQRRTSRRVGARARMVSSR